MDKTGAGGLNQPLSDLYHRRFWHSWNGVPRPPRLANEAADRAAVVRFAGQQCPALVETDVRCLEKVLQMLRQQEPDAEKILAPIQKPETG
ncbi:MAG: hypothetical protein ACLT29_00490 [Ruminococcus callidus]